MEHIAQKGAVNKAEPLRRSDMLISSFSLCSVRVAVFLKPEKPGVSLLVEKATWEKEKKYCKNSRFH